MYSDAVMGEADARQSSEARQQSGHDNRGMLPAYQGTALLLGAVAINGSAVVNDSTNHGTGLGTAGLYCYQRDTRSTF